MPESDAVQSCSPARLLVLKPRGFTLIELMVVVAIVALMSGIVVVSINTDSEAKQLRAVVEKLYSVIKFSSQEALLRGEEYGLVFYRDGYRFLQWNEAPPVSVNSPAAPSAILSDKADESEPSHWALNESADFLGEERVNQQIVLNLIVEEEEIELEEVEAHPIKEKSADIISIGDDDKPLVPMIYLLSSGESTAFSLELSSADNPQLRYKIIGNIVGNLRILKPGETE